MPKGENGDTSGITAEILRVLRGATKLMTCGEIYEAGQFEDTQPVYNALHAMSQVSMQIVRLKGNGHFMYGMPGHKFEVPEAPKPVVEEKPVERVIEKPMVGLERFNKRFDKQIAPDPKFVAKTKIVIPTLAKPTIRDIADKYVGPYATAIKDLEAKMGTHLLQADKCRAAIEALKAL